MKSEIVTIEPLEIQKKVKNAINKLFEKDFYLLKANANERSISHKLALYIQEEFEEFDVLDVDCEYNRDKLHNPKKIKDWRSRCIKDIKPDDEDAKTVFPDIIIHQRDSSKNNLLVLEIKKSSNSDTGKCDREKIKNFINDPGLHYELGVFINFGVKNKARTFCWNWFPEDKFGKEHKNEC
ncbi:hypothetical protein [Methanobacterium aggregans]|uniref:hypothetical protein n=1 Tax=Methanobacterium aggregans TaxID=1615586 RepID=UPI001AE73D2E|nr:hypothetical protein [Methanobacterium aggregans]MBP2045304.1 hypothetical protein [Methanobacterium aggregans]